MTAIDIELEAKLIRRKTIVKLRKATDDVQVDLEDISSRSDSYKEHTRCLALARTKLQEAKMWMGMSIAGLEIPEEHDPFPKKLRDFSDKR